GRSATSTIRRATRPPPAAPRRWDTKASGPSIPRRLRSPTRSCHRRRRRSTGPGASWWPSRRPPGRQGRGPARRAHDRRGLGAHGGKRGAHGGGHRRQDQKVTITGIQSRRAIVEIHEYQAKEILSGFGIQTLSAGLAYSPEQAVYRAKEIGGNVWVVKAQIHSGARGKAGGIKVCRND